MVSSVVLEVHGNQSQQAPWWGQVALRSGPHGAAAAEGGAASAASGAITAWV